jgi:hypothetical protein
MLSSAVFPVAHDVSFRDRFGPVLPDVRGWIAPARRLR